MRTHQQFVTSRRASTRRARRIAVGTLGAVAASVVVASPSTALPPPTFEFGVGLGNTYSPAEATIQAGEHAFWEAIGGASFADHPLHFENAEFPDVLGGLAFDEAFKTPGDVLFSCTVHGPAMSGVLHVVSGTAPTVKITHGPAVVGQPVVFDLDIVDADLGDSDSSTHEWDLDGDGDFEFFSKGASKSAEITYLSVGQRTVKVRVKDPGNQTTTQSVVVDVVPVVIPDPPPVDQPPAVTPVDPPKPAQTTPVTSTTPTPTPTDIVPIVAVKDVTAPTLTLPASAAASARRVLASGVYSARVTVSEGGKLAARLSTRSGTVLGRVDRTTAAGTVTLKLRLTAAGRRALKRAPAAGLRLTLSVRVTDSTGNTRLAKRAVTVRR